MSLDVYTGAYSNFSGGYDRISTTSWDGFVQKWRNLSAGPLCLTGLDTYQENHTTTWFTGVWTQTQGTSAGPPCLWSVPDWSTFMQHHAECSVNARLLDFDITPNDGWQRSYIGTWGGHAIEQVIKSDLGWDAFVREWKTLSGQGLRLAKAKAYPAADPGVPLHLTGLFEKATSPGEGYALILTPTWSVFYSNYQNYSGHLQLVDYQVCDDDHGTRWYLGVWRGQPSSSLSPAQQLIFDQDYNNFWNKWAVLSPQGWRLRTATRYSRQVRVPRPNWDEYFKRTLEPQTQGYAYIVMKNGIVVANGSYGNARNDHDGKRPFNLNTRIHLASVSKAITATTVLKLLHDRNISVDAPFWNPIMKRQIPTVGPGVDKVTIRQLLNMTSGMDLSWNAIFFNTSQYWVLLNSYLERQNVTENGKAYLYSNTNFVILQALVDCLLGNNGNSPTLYPDYVLNNILRPMGISSTQWTIHDDPQASATLSYGTPPSSTEPGVYWGDVQNIGGGAWVASALELAKFQQGIRRNVVLDAATTAEMLDGNLGLDYYWNDCLYGNVYHKNGILQDGATKGLRTVIASLPFGYDVLLLTNTWLPNLDTLAVVLNAFEVQNSSSSSTPSYPAADPKVEVDGDGPMSYSMVVWPSDPEVECSNTSGWYAGACGRKELLWKVLGIARMSYSFFSNGLSQVFEW